MRVGEGSQVGKLWRVAEENVGIVPEMQGDAKEILGEVRSQVRKMSGL